MKSNRSIILLIVALLLLAVVIAVGFRILNPPKMINGRVARNYIGGSNIALDIRYQYDPTILTPAEYDGRAEYPLRLDSELFSFYGKRIRGVAKYLSKDPGPLLYDFVGSQHVEDFEEWYRLEPVGEPLYDDTYINGRLGLIQKLLYKRTASSRKWPNYFPVSIKGSENANQENQLVYVTGWALFSENDLFFFQTVSASELSEENMEACSILLDSIEFDAMLPTPVVETPEDEDQTENPQSVEDDQRAQNDPANAEESDSEVSE